MKDSYNSYLVLMHNRYKRDSNFELARIVAMLMIVVGHFVVHGIWESDFCIVNDLQRPWNCIVENLIYSFCVSGVNIFVLISGYYKIKLKLKSCLSLWLLCAFYGIIAAIVNINAEETLLLAIVKALFISKSHWFFSAYLWLLLISPLLNSGIDSMSKRNLRGCVLILFILNCISGWVFNNANADGYNVLQMIFIYVVGQWLRRDSLIKIFNANQYLVAFILFCLLICLTSVLSLFIIDGSNFPIYFYNNPLIVFASISLFCFFSQISIQSNIINTIAATVVAALFIQDFIASEWIYASVNNAYNIGVGVVIMCCIMWVVLIFLSAFLMENLRQVVCQPIIKKLVFIAEKLSVERLS